MDTLTVYAIAITAVLAVLGTVGFFAYRAHRARTEVMRDVFAGSRRS